MADLNTNRVISRAREIFASHRGFSWHQLFALAAVDLGLPDPDVAAALAETEALRTVADHADGMIGGEIDTDLVQAACDELGFEDDACFAETALRIYEHRQYVKNGAPPVPPAYRPMEDRA